MESKHLKLKEEINRIVGELRSKYFSKIPPVSPDKPVSVFIEEGYRLKGGPGKALVIILATKGCRWGLKSGCTMCGYVYDSVRKRVSSDLLLSQFQKALKKLRKEVCSIKIFTSGSFFDEKEVPEEAREKIMSLISEIESVEEVVVESRPEFISKDSVKRCLEALKGKELEVALGLESSDDFVVNVLVNKNSSYQEFLRAVKEAKEAGALVKAYILLKPPFMSEKDSIEDAVKTTVNAVKAGVNSISYNLCNVQRGSLVEVLWRNGYYRPPWLWSIIEVLKRTAKVRKGVRTLLGTAGWGTRRGAHNCGRCDERVKEFLRKFVETQDETVLDNLSCKCMRKWEAILELENLTLITS